MELSALSYILKNIAIANRPKAFMEESILNEDAI